MQAGDRPGGVSQLRRALSLSVFWPGSGRPKKDEKARTFSALSSRCVILLLVEPRPIPGHQARKNRHDRHDHDHQRADRDRLPAPHRRRRGKPAAPVDADQHGEEPEEGEAICEGSDPGARCQARACQGRQARQGAAADVVDRGPLRPDRPRRPAAQPDPKTSANDPGGGRHHGSVVRRGATAGSSEATSTASPLARVPSGPRPQGLGAFGLAQPLLEKQHE